MPERAAEGRILVGVFGAPHGVRGEIRLKSHTADPAGIGRLGPLQAPKLARAFEIANLRVVRDDLLVVRLRGVDTREAAERLTHVELFVDRKNLPAADEDEFYHADLIGLPVFDEAGALFGRVSAVQNFGAGDLLEIARPGMAETVLMPFTKAVVPHVDLANGRLTIVPPLETAVEGHEPAPGEDGR